MLYLCLSLIALLCVFPHTKRHNIHSLYILYWVCYACQNHPFFDEGCVHTSQWEDSFVVRLPDPTCNTDDFLLTLWHSTLNYCVVQSGGCPTLEHLACFWDWPSRLLWHSFPPAQTHSRTSTHCQANADKIIHSPSSEMHLSSAWFALKFG